MSSYGAGTMPGRRAIVGDSLREHADLAALWIANPARPGPRLDVRAVEGQPSLFEAHH